MTDYLKSRISPLVKELISAYGEAGSTSPDCFAEVLNFIYGQMERMPLLPGFAIRAMTLLFGFCCLVSKAGVSPGSNSETACGRQLQAWSRSSFRPFRDFVRFYTAMVVLSLYSGSQQPVAAKVLYEE
jgi:hypothetical protein